jgi:hypothetical protein
LFLLQATQNSLDTLSKALAFGATVFEDDDVLIQKKVIVLYPKPDFPHVLLGF